MRIGRGMAIVLAAFSLLEATVAGARQTAQPETQTPLEFEASGIRGVIDPGGYSASTGSAAVELLRGMADLKRTEREARAAEAKRWPCAQEPILHEELRQHPVQALARRRLGEFYLAHGQLEHALPLLQRALDIAPADDQAARALAIAQMRKGEFEAAVRLDQNLSQAHYQLALAYRHLGRFEPATREMELFQLLRKGADAGDREKGISLAQLVSAMDSPSASSEQLRCPAPPSDRKIIDK